jgi:hypothetical protein
MVLDTKLAVSWDEPLETTLAVLAAGLVTVEQLKEAAATRRRKRPVIGKLALKQGMMSMAQVFRVLEQQAFTGELFGEVAVSLGFLNEVDLFKLLQLQAALAPALVDVLVAQGAITAATRDELQVHIRQRLRVQRELATALTN